MSTLLVAKMGLSGLISVKPKLGFVYFSTGRLGTSWLIMFQLA